MKLFVDHIRADWKQGWAEHNHQFEGAARDSLDYWLFNAPVFLNSDAIERVARGEVELEQLPSFAPPYGNLFVEANIPFVTAHEESEGSVKVRIGNRMAMHVIGFDRQHPESHSEDDGGKSAIDGCIPLDESELRWTLNFMLFTEGALHKPKRFAMATVFLDGDGKPLPLMQGENVGYSYVRLDEAFFGEIGDFMRSMGYSLDTWYEFAETALNAGMYTLGMLHCRNIGTQVFEPKAAENHKYERKHGIPMTKYHILKITGKGRDAGELIGVNSGRRMPLHWVRGHWRTYTDDAPLFGTVTGTFYVHEHIRGTLKAGAVAKDYEVKV